MSKFFSAVGNSFNSITGFLFSAVITIVRWNKVLFSSVVEILSTIVKKLVEWKRAIPRDSVLMRFFKFIFALTLIPLVVTVFVSQIFDFVMTPFFLLNLFIDFFFNFTLMFLQYAVFVVPVVVAVYYIVGMIKGIMTPTSKVEIEMPTSEANVGRHMPDELPQWDQVCTQFGARLHPDDLELTDSNNEMIRSILHLVRM